ncbi:MAG: B12-binding domain-containing protein [Candidatus Hodarchaeota archaeon]
MTLEDDLKEAILEWDEDGLRDLCNTSMQNKKKTPAELLKIIGDVMRYIGELFEKEEIFLPDLIGSAETVKTIIDGILDPAIRASGEKKETRGKVVIGTVESDVHSIGKDLVASFLFSNGYEVYNLGVEVPALKFIEKAEEVEAQVIAMSSLLTMSMDFQRELIAELEKQGLRNKYKVIVGGSPTSEDWSEQIGADGWADDAIEAVNLVNKILSK